MKTTRCPRSATVRVRSPRVGEAARSHRWLQPQYRMLLGVCSLRVEGNHVVAGIGSGGSRGHL